MKRFHLLVAGLLITTIITATLSVPPSQTALAASPAGGPQLSKDTTVASAANGSGKELWQSVAGTPRPARAGAKPAVKPRRLGSYTLNRGGMAALLVTTPRERSAAARENPLVLSLPSPRGEFQRFVIQEAPIMEPGLAAKHPEIKTYSGRGIDDPAATIRFDLTPLGFHASVRSPGGAWYIDPYYHLDQSLYASYYGRDLPIGQDNVFVERDAESAELSVDRGYYHAADTVVLHGSGFTSDAEITITISDPEAHFAARTLSARSDALGSFDASFVADPDGNLDTHIVEANDGNASALAAYQVVRDDDPTTDPPTGDVLRTYRLALITDPGYATFFGGSANVTAAKVTLMNRVSQIYEDDLSIRLQLVANNDLLNLDTWDKAIAPNGPCGAAGCFTQPQVTGCSSTTRARFVIGQIIGASNYDIGHLALGQPGGGVANLGVVGRSNKAGGCTGIPTPVGDFYAVDYVAHEMGHQFSGNHPFNGNQLNCSGGNRSPATSVEPGSGSSIMAYAGICLTDDLQPHSDPYFSQRSLQEISTYTSSNQAAINEVQTASLRHFGGGNEVQVVTFGPGYARTATIQPLSVAINAAPSATSRGGAEENGNIATIATGNAHTLQVGDVVTISGVAVAGYNGTFTVSAVPTTRSFQYTNPIAGLQTSGGGTVTLAAPGATESGTTVTISTAAAHGRSVGDVVTISGVGVSGYNGIFTITGAPTPRSFEYTAASSGLANSGAGTMTFFSPFQVRIGGNDSALIGGGGLPYTAANIQSAINAIPGFAGSVAIGGAASTGFTVTYGGASAGVDVPNIELVSLSCGGCFASVEETNHGGASDSFQLNYNGNVSAPIVNGVNYSAAGILAALTPLLPVGATATVAGFGGGTFNNTGFQVTFTGALATTNVPVLLALQDFSAGASGFFGETDKGGAVDNKGGIITVTENAFPLPTAPTQFTIPLRTPFALTGSATDVNDDPLIYAWEQNDRGGGAGTSLLSNTKANGPLFAMFPKSGQISEADTLLYNSPGENSLTTSPTRVFPDLQQILDNNTNAETGACSAGPIAAPVPIPVKECFAEFLPTADYVGFTGVNASPLSLHFRFTARDGRGGVNAAPDTTLLLATNAGPFLVTSPNTAATWQGLSSQTITWNPANTQNAPVNTANVKISLSADGGLTYPYVLAASTSNDGSEAVIVPNVGTAQARIKIEAVENIFFDLSNANFTIQAVPVVTNSLGGGSQPVQYSDSLSPDLTITATDPDTLGKNLTASASGLPAGLSLAIVSTTDDSTLPGSRTWKVAGSTTTAPGAYNVSVTVTDDTGSAVATSFTIVVTQEDARATYSGNNLFWTSSASSTSANVTLSATIRDITAVAGDPAYDPNAGDIRNATVTFVNRDTNTAFTGCSNLPIGLVSAGDTKTGTATCNTTLAVSNATGATQYTVGIVVNGYYTRNHSTDNDIITVAQPLTSSFITGGGNLVLSNSSGLVPGTAGSKANFGFNVKYNKSGTNLQGNVNIIIRSGGRVYQIKSNAISSLGVAVPKANFTGKANIRDITNPLNPISVDGNATLQLWLTDNGELGSKDTLGIQVLNKNGGTWFASNWNGTKTVEQNLGGGNLVVR
jgi:hypothetical protein